MANPNQLKQERAELRKKLAEYAKEGPTMQAVRQVDIEATKLAIFEIDESLSRIEALSYGGNHHQQDRPAVVPEGYASEDVGGDFGWPGNGGGSNHGSNHGSNGRRKQGGLKEAMLYATEDQREEVKAFAAFLRGRTIEALSNLTPSGDGGVLIPTFVYAAIERNYSQFSPVVDNCRIFSTDTGADEKFPVISDSESAEQVDSAGETGATDDVAGDTPPTSLGGPTMKAYKISSKPVFIPRETLTDSDIDLISEVVGALLARVTRYENKRYTTGTGSAQAEGFLMNSATYEGLDTLDLDVALELAYSVPALYRPNGIYMCSDTTVKYLRKLKTGISGDKRYLWKEVFEEGNATLGTPARLHGYPLYVNNDMSDCLSNGSYFGGLNSPLAFGDFKKFVVRQAEQNRPYLWNYPVPRKDGRAVILFRRSDSHLLVDSAISKLAPSGS